MIRSKALILVTLCLLLLTCRSTQAQSQPSAEEEIQALTKERAKTHEDLENADKWAAHLEQSVVIMLGFTTLVIAVLFGTTILGEIRIREAIKKLEQEAEEVKARFPKLVAMETQAGSALREIELRFGSAGAEDWLEDIYAGLPIDVRQRILTVEHLIALELAGRNTAPQLRGMANFYSSKYKSEKLASDLDRALYYALIAAQRGKRNFQYLNDLGFIYMELAARDGRYWGDAEKVLHESKEKHPRQQRCYYNLTVILFTEAEKKRELGDTDEYFRLLHEVRKLSEIALGHRNWELQISPQLTSLIHYNFSCYLCRLSEQNPGTRADAQNHLLDEAIRHLHQASLFQQTKLETVDADFTEPSGDLCVLARNSFYADHVQEARTKFSQNWTKA